MLLKCYKIPFPNFYFFFTRQSILRRKLVRILTSQISLPALQTEASNPPVSPVNLPSRDHNHRANHRLPPKLLIMKLDSCLTTRRLKLRTAPLNKTRLLKTHRQKRKLLVVGQDCRVKRHHLRINLHRRQLQIISQRFRSSLRNRLGKEI